jgi:hypothetical protein
MARAENLQQARRSHPDEPPTARLIVPSLDTIAAVPAKELPALALGLAAAQAAVAARLAAIAEQPRDETYATVEQVAAELEVDPAWVYRQSARWPFAVKLSPKVVRIERAGLRRWLAQRRRR